MTDHEKYLKQCKKQYQKNKLNAEWIKKRKVWCRNNYLRHRKNGTDSIKWKGIHGIARRQSRIFKYLEVLTNRLYKDSKICAFDLAKIFKKQKGHCALTGQRLTRDNMSVDHIVPKSSGGQNVPSNLRLTTKSVNIMRNTMDDLTFHTLCQQVVNTLSTMPTEGSNTPTIPS